MENLKDFSLKLVLGLVNNKDIVKVQDFTDDDNNTILDIIVHSDDMKVVIGKSGNTVKAIKTLIQACAYKNGINNVKVNIDSI